jgi:hypothetical protein
MIEARYIIIKALKSWNNDTSPVHSAFLKPKHKFLTKAKNLALLFLLTKLVYVKYFCDQQERTWLNISLKNLKNIEQRLFLYL